MLHPMLGSSVDPNKLSLTVKGILIALIPLFIAIGRMNGLELIETNLVQIINGIATLIATVVTLWGLIRKIKNS